MLEELINLQKVNLNVRGPRSLWLIDHFSLCDLYFHLEGFKKASSFDFFYLILFVRFKMEELAKYFKDLPMLDPKGPDNIDLVSKLKTFFPSSADFNAKYGRAFLSSKFFSPAWFLWVKLHQAKARLIFSN